MAKIIHTSTGASNSPRELIVTPKIVGVPTGELFLWTDENGYIEHETFSGRIASVLNQVADAFPDIYSLGCYGYDHLNNGARYPTVDTTQFDGINCLKFIVPRQYSSYWRMGRTAFFRRKGLYGIEPYTGTTTSGLIKISPGLQPEAGRRALPLPHVQMGSGFAGSAAFYFPQEVNGQWQCQKDTYSFIDVGNPGDFPDPVDEWHLFTTVVQTTPTHIGRLYIDGEKVFDVSLSASSYMESSFNYVNIVNMSTNPLDYIFSGYVAHSAAWLRPLSDSEVLRYWDVIKNKYGLA